MTEQQIEQKVEARVLADTLSPSRHRLLTLEVTLPRFLLAELNTHRALSRNTASSRAIPTSKLIEDVENRPFVPKSFGRNKPGMQSTETLSDQEEHAARAAWLRASSDAAGAAKVLLACGVHKQHANRVLEPFLWTKSVVSGTEWDNFFAQRLHPDAQPEFRALAQAMSLAIRGSNPRELTEEEASVPSSLEAWHLPYGDDAVDLLNGGLSLDDIILVCVGRCARVSYMRQGDSDVESNIALARRLRESGHMSPYEHIAVPIHPRAVPDRFVGNFRGWVQKRKMIPGESVFRPSSSGH